MYWNADVRNDQSLLHYIVPCSLTCPEASAVASDVCIGVFYRGVDVIAGLLLV